MIPGWEDPLEEGMAVYSSILAWRIPWTEEPDRLQYIGSQVGHNLVTREREREGKLWCLLPWLVLNESSVIQLRAHSTSWLSLGEILDHF